MSVIGSDAGAGLTAGMVAGLGIAMPIGAIGTYLVALGARGRAAVAAAAALGVASTDGVYALIATTGGGALAGVLRPVAEPLRWTSAAALTGLAVLTARTGLRRYRRPDTPPGRRTDLSAPRAYLSLLGLTALNPATLAYFTALVLGRSAGRGAGALPEAAFVIGAFAASAAWQLTLAATGAAVGHVLGGRRGQLAIATASALVMLGLAVALALRSG